MPSVDFNWQEGDEAFSGSAEENQPQPQAFAPPAPAPPPAPLADEGKDRKPRPSLIRASNLLLLAIGITLGIGVGFAILTFQGQRNVRADLAPVVQLQYQALAQNDQDLYDNLIDPEDDAWRELLAGAFPVSSFLYDFEAGQPRVTRVELKGDRAEVEIESGFGGERYRRMETMRLVDGQWRLTRSTSEGWGEVQTLEGGNITLHYRERDAFVADSISHLDAVVQTFCERYAPPPPCMVDLSIEPNPDLLPFVPGDGAAPLPPTTEYIVMAEGTTGIITINGTGEEIRDQAFQDRLLGYIEKRDDIREIYASRTGSSEAKRSSEMRLYQQQMPLSIISPRLVGMDGDEPHPLWWLALHEAIGDVIMRRGLRPITAPQPAAYTVWAIARGDVALWAERLSGVRLPEIEITAEDTSSVGEALLLGDGSQRGAARSLALYLHYRDMGDESEEALSGELATLQFLRGARNTWETGPMFAILDTDPDRLTAGWRAWLAERQ